MSEEKKNGLALMILGLIIVIVGCILWAKYPENITHMFFIYLGGKFIGEGKENL